MKRIILILGIAVFIVLAALAFRSARSFIEQDRCLDRGGKWATNGDYCIALDCAKDSSCKPSYNNGSICSTLKTGITSDELYFHLGMPEGKIGDAYTFSGGGAGSPITAVITNGIVRELQCGQYKKAAS